MKLSPEQLSRLRASKPKAIEYFCARCGGLASAVRFDLVEGQLKPFHPLCVPFRIAAVTRDK